MLARIARGVAGGLLLGACSLVACSNPSGEGDAGSGPMQMTCDVTAPRECPDPAPGFADVEPIFAERCLSCHAGVAGGPWPLTSYGHIASWRNEIRAVLLSCAMPPPDAGVQMTDDERVQILTWLRCDLPQ